MAAINKLLLLQTKIILLIILRRRLRARKAVKKYKKRMWVRELFKHREEKSEYNILVKDLRLFDSEFFFKSFRMSPRTFEELLSWVAPLIEKSPIPFFTLKLFNFENNFNLKVAQFLWLAKNKNLPNYKVYLTSQKILILDRILFYLYQKQT